MLVLVDGRSVYTELFSGVFWSTLDLPLEEIDRIEVVRGPGGTVWGTNAVNGVINIITRPARDLDGAALGLRVGTEDRLEGVLRAGGAIGEDAHLLVYTKSRDTRALEPPAGGVESGGELTRGGFRAEWAADSGDRWTLFGDAYRNDIERTFQLIDRAPPYTRLGDPAREYAGGSLQLRWERDLADGGQLQLQTAYSVTRLDTTVLGEDAEAFDLDWQHRLPLGERQDLVWGLGYRYSRSETRPGEVLFLDPADETFQRASAFVQDEISVTDELDFIVGTKLEYHQFTGLEVQPSARVAWAIDENETLWAAVSRAVRTPSLVERGIRSLPAVDRARVPAGFRHGLQPRRGPRLRVGEPPRLRGRLAVAARRGDLARPDGLPPRLRGSQRVRPRGYADARREHLRAGHRLRERPGGHRLRLRGGRPAPRRRRLDALRGLRLPRARPAAGMDDYLPKPVIGAELEATLDRWMTWLKERSAA